MSSSPLPWIVVGVAVGALVLTVLVYRATRRPRRRAPPAVAYAAVSASIDASPAGPRRTLALPPRETFAPRRTLALAPRKTAALAPWTGPEGIAGWLVALSGASPYTTSVVNRSGETTIGADPDCGIVIQDAWVGGVHCKIVGRSGYFTIVDLASRNGVYVNGERVWGDCTLHSGMEIRIGQTRFAWQAIELAGRA